jgi:hypothetical protein
MDTPALDFLRKVEIWQQPGTGSVPVSMPSSDAKTLRTLLKDVRREGAYPELERQARRWLIGYRELSPMLDEEQQAQLDVAIDGQPKPALPKSSPAADLRARSRAMNRGFYWAVGVTVVAGLIVLGILIVAIVRDANPANPVQQGSQSQAHPAPQQVAPGTTALENLISDWGPWKQLATSQQNPQSGAPALLLLNQGGYYASENWTVPVSPSWAPDLSGNVTAVDVQGNHAQIEDADGNPWTVTINQPFVFASNPGTILVVNPAGDVLSTTTAHAIAWRTHI